MQNPYGFNGMYHDPWFRHPANPPVNSPRPFALPPMVPQVMSTYNYPNNLHLNPTHMNAGHSWPQQLPNPYFNANVYPPFPHAHTASSTSTSSQLAYIEQNCYPHQNVALRPPQELQLTKSINDEQNVFVARNNATLSPSRVQPYRREGSSNSSLKHFPTTPVKQMLDKIITHTNQQSLNSLSETPQRNSASHQPSSLSNQVYPKDPGTNSSKSHGYINENVQQKNTNFLAKNEKCFSTSGTNHVNDQNKNGGFYDLDLIKVPSKKKVPKDNLSSSCGSLDTYNSSIQGKRLCADNDSYRSSNSLEMFDGANSKKRVCKDNVSLSSSSLGTYDGSSSEKTVCVSDKSLTSSDMSLTSSSSGMGSLSKSNCSESSSPSRIPKHRNLDNGNDHDSSRSYKHSKDKKYEKDDFRKYSSRSEHQKTHSKYDRYGKKPDDRSNYYRSSEKSNKYRYDQEKTRYDKKSSAIKDHHRSSERSEQKCSRSKSMEKSSARKNEVQIVKSDQNHENEIGREKHCSSKSPAERSRKRSCSQDRFSSPTRSSEKSSQRSKSMKVKKALLDMDTCQCIKSTPDEMFYTCSSENSNINATGKLQNLHLNFKQQLVERAKVVCASKPKYEPPQRKTILRKPKPPKMFDDSEDSWSSEESSSSDEEDTAMQELEKKKRHPHRLHPELWFNDPKEMNDGPLCRCSAKAGRSGIRHGIYVGEDKLLRCNQHSNNINSLYHYRITMTPRTNFMTKCPTTIKHSGQNFTFEGFSMFSHSELPMLPNCKVIRFNYEYTILYIKEEFPNNFTVGDLDLFSSFLFEEILELVDLNLKAHDDPDGCPRFHFMPRFMRKVGDDKKQLLPMNVVLQYLLSSNDSLVKEESLTDLMSYSQSKWQNLADKVKGMIVTCPGMKPSSVRVDQLDRERGDKDNDKKDDGFPVIVHFGVRPPQLSYAGNPMYQKAWRSYVKFRHLLANKPKVMYEDRHQLQQKEYRLQQMRMENDLKRDVTVVISSKGFYKTGIMSDIVQHAMLLPVLVCHLRFHQSLSVLEDIIGYKFQDRFLLQLALTHPSYRENFGTNPDHARNSLTNCGLRQPQYGDRRIHYMNTRKRGINTLINIMSRFGSNEETLSSINHNERLEFLGDAVVEFLSSIHLFYMFPDLEEGGLATYRAAIVQNQHLAVLAKKLQLERFMLYAHGSDLCHDLELRHAMANCFEALMGALFLDAGIEVADKVFSATLFTEPELLEVWKNYPPHPLQEQEPHGDRKWVALVPLLQKLYKFEQQIGIEFTHIRLLARSLTHRSIGFNNLTLGSNQRLEFLGDTVLQLVASEYLYKFFPEHHEGHLSLLRSSLVNNRTQAVVCGDLGMIQYAIYPLEKVELKTKDRADLLEAFLGALYVDKGLGYCRKFCEVCFFPRLEDFIMNQDWNDPKSKLQQCCLTLRSMDGGEPDIPTYKVIECKGPTNTRVYSVAVYFQGNRLAVGNGHSIQQAEMDAASNALRKSRGLFPQLRHQRRAIQRSLKQEPPSKKKKKRDKKA